MIDGGKGRGRRRGRRLVVACLCVFGGEEGSKQGETVSPKVVW